MFDQLLDSSINAQSRNGDMKEEIKRLFEQYKRNRRKMSPYNNDNKKIRFQQENNYPIHFFEKFRIFIMWDESYMGSIDNMEILKYNIEEICSICESRKIDMLIFYIMNYDTSRILPFFPKDFY
jgi:hypothetical protein